MKAAPLIGISRHRLSTDGEGVTTLVAFMVARCAANIASIRNLYTQKIYGSTMTAGSFMRKSNRMSYIFSLLTEALHSEAENLVYRAISLMNSVNSVDRNGSFP